MRAIFYLKGPRDLPPFRPKLNEGPGNMFPRQRERASQDRAEGAAAGGFGRGGLPLDRREQACNSARQGGVGAGKKNVPTGTKNPLAPSYPEVIRGAVTPSANTAGYVPGCIHPGGKLPLERIQGGTSPPVCAQLSRTLSLCEYRGGRHTLYSF